VKQEYRLLYKRPVLWKRTSSCAFGALVGIEERIRSSRTESIMKYTISLLLAIFVPFKISQVPGFCNWSVVYGKAASAPWTCFLEFCIGWRTVVSEVQGHSENGALVAAILFSKQEKIKIGSYRGNGEDG